jgi:hypothetical protein
MMEGMFRTKNTENLDPNKEGMAKHNNFIETHIKQLMSASFSEGIFKGISLVLSSSAAIHAFQQGAFPQFNNPEMVGAVAAGLVAYFASKSAKNIKESMVNLSK